MGYRSKCLSLLLGYALVGCTSEMTDGGSDVGSAEQGLISGAGEATIAVQSDWGQGYCADVTVANKGTSDITNWTVGLKVPAASINNLWNGNRSGTTVTPVANSNNRIAKGGKVTFGFCANVTGSGSHVPSVATLSVVGVGNGGSSGAGPSFMGGPCVAANADGVTVFAKGKNKKVYSKLLPSGKWQALPLDASQLDMRSDLDCYGGVGSTITLTATSPIGPDFLSVVTTGTGGKWADFSMVPSSPSSKVTSSVGNGYFVSGSSPVAVYRLVDHAYLVATTVETNNQGIDSSAVSGGLQIASVLSSGSAGVVSYVGGFGVQPSFSPLTLIPPPSGQRFEGSPGICAAYGVVAADNYVTAVSQNNLWVSGRTRGTNSYAAWEKLSSVSVAASPDCVQRFSGSSSGLEMHLVALTTAGTILHVQGARGSWNRVEDLGVYAP